jgi:uncharacterized membrane protein
MSVRVLHLAAGASLATLLLLCLAWELWLAPLRPGGSWLALKALPLALALPGVLRGRVYTCQWSLLLVLAYLAEGTVRAYSERGTAAQLAWAEIALAVIYFGCAIYYIRMKRRERPPPDVAA